MTKLRILNIGLNRRDSVKLHGRHYFLEEMARQAEVVSIGWGYPEYRKGETVEQAVKRLGPFDWVWGCYRGSVPSARLCIDIHTLDWSLRDVYKSERPWSLRDVYKSGCNLLFFVVLHTYYTISEEAWVKHRTSKIEPCDPDHFQKTLRIPMIWLPWSIEPSTFKDWGLEKKWDVLLTGSYGLCYPLRTLFRRELPLLAEKHGLKALIRERVPGRRGRFKISEVFGNPVLRKRFSVFTDFSKLLNQSKIFLMGCSIFKYALQKVFEATASGCLLMCNRPDMADELGLVSGENYVRVSRRTWRDRLLYYLENDKERRRITRNGYSWAMKHHTNRVRVGQMLEVFRAYPDVEKWDRRIGVNR